MQELVNLEKSNLNLTLKEKNQQSREIYMNNRKDEKMRRTLRENRIQRINAYRDEQVAALKN